MKIKGYDNGGSTLDRYTIIIGKDVWIMSHNPTSPQGICLYFGKASCHYIVDREIKVLSLPTSVQLKIYDIQNKRINNENTTKNFI